MTETQRVPAPRLPLSGHGDVAALILVGIAMVLIAKPWGAPAIAGDPTAQPQPSIAGATARPTPVEAGFAYDQSVFGPFEPVPEWSVWPGGFFVTLLYVTRATDQEPTAALPSGSRPPPTAPASSPAAAASDGWPASITIGQGAHLLWLGLNTPSPLNVRAATVWRLDRDGGRLEVPAVRLPTEWGPNFAVIGIPVAPGSHRLSVWPQGTYEVAVRLDPTGEMRTILVEIRTLADPAGAPSDEPPP